MLTSFKAGILQQKHIIFDNLYNAICKMIIKYIEQQSYAATSDPIILEFKKIFYLSLIPVFFAGLLSILMAYLGYGVYALVANSLINGFLSICLYSFYLKWYPKFQISIKRIRILFNFSYKLLLANLILLKIFFRK